MKPSELIEALAYCRRAGRPPFIWGQPGVGKSQIMRQAAAAEGIELIDRRLVMMDPVDLHGVPYAQLIDPAAVKSGKVSSWAEPAFLPRSGAGYLFLDEFAQCSPAVQNAASQLILDRRLGDYVLPDGWTVVAAGNNAADRAATHRMPQHIASRFLHLQLDVDADDWGRHALRSNFAIEVISFLRFRPELLHKFDANNSKDKTYPCPRTWEFVSDVIREAPPKNIELSLYAGCVGEAAAVEFVGYLGVCRTLPSVEAILMNPATAPVPDAIAARFAITGALARKASETNFAAVATYAARLPKEFEITTIKNTIARVPGVQNTRVYAQWCSDNADVLV